MKAWMLNNIDEFNFYEDVPIPDINSDEVLLKVKAAGICGSDVPRVYKNGAHNMPLIIGHEFAGIVEKAGSSDNKYLVGKHVGVFPLIPCKKCPACLSKRYEMCSNYSYLGSRINGGFAEYVSVPAWNLIEIPDSITFEQAAMLEPMAVSVHAIRQLNLRKDDNVLVCGAGTIGQLIVIFLLEAGIKNVYVLGTKTFHREILKKIGLPEHNFYLVKDTNQKDLVDFYMSATHSNGIDAYFECVGKNDTISQGIDIVNPGGS